MATMTCPKCRGEMISYERNSITVDQCGDCRGIFLDRGELDHLLAADTRAHTPAPSAAPPPRGQPDRSYDSHDSHRRRPEHDDDDDDYRGHERHGSSSSKRKKQKHWVEELFG